MYLVGEVRDKPFSIGFKKELVEGDTLSFKIKSDYKVDLNLYAKWTTDGFTWKEENVNFDMLGNEQLFLNPAYLKPDPPSGVNTSYPFFSVGGKSLQDIGGRNQFNGSEETYERAINYRGGNPNISDLDYVKIEFYLSTNSVQKQIQVFPSEGTISPDNNWQWVDGNWVWIGGVPVIAEDVTGPSVDRPDISEDIQSEGIVEDNNENESQDTIGNIGGGSQVPVKEDSISTAQNQISWDIVGVGALIGVGLLIVVMIMRGRNE